MDKPRKIAVAGATGRAGGHTVAALREQGVEVVEISRSHGVDVTTGEGLDAALEGVDVIVDAATGPSPDQQGATEFFTTASRVLQEHAERAGVQRIVVTSIVGIDAFNKGYYAAKNAQETAALSGPVPVRILRATQFHEFVEELAGWGVQGDVAYVPFMRTQIVHSSAVGAELARLALDPAPAPILQDIAGPREERLADLARAVFAKRGKAITVQEVREDILDPDGLMEQGALLPAAGVKLAGPTFDDWLASTD